jgi:hypothetical protein
LTVDKQKKFKTKLGGFFSVIFTLTTLLYGSFRAYIMVCKFDTSFAQNTITNYFDSTKVFSSIEQAMDEQGNVSKKRGFNIAFGVFNSD